VEEERKDNVINIKELNITNQHFVARARENVQVAIPPSIFQSRGDALVFAAWIVALADDDDEFSAILDRVRST